MYANCSAFVLRQFGGSEEPMVPFYRSAAIVACLLSLACERPRPVGQTASVAAGSVVAVREVIERANASYVDAMLKGDATGMVAIYADEAMTMMPDESVRRGRQQLEQAMRETLRQTTFTAATFRTEDVQLAGDLAVETGTGAVAFTTRGVVTPETLQLTYLTVWRRQPDGSLRIIRDTPREPQGHGCPKVRPQGALSLQDANGAAAAHSATGASSQSRPACE
jgi:uncharacterized protein (TIGR02246 family)